MSKLKESQMEEWLLAVDVILRHVDNDEDTVLRSRARAFARESTDIKKMIEGWLACDKAHSIYTGL